MNKLTLFLVLLIFASCSKRVELTFNNEVYSVNDSLIDAKINYFTIHSNSEELNIWLDEFNNDILNKFKTKTKEISEMSLKLRAEYLPSDYPPFALDVRDSLFFISSKLVSVRYLEYEMSGGAHGNSSYYSYNFIPDKKLMLSKENIIKSDDKSLKAINDLLKKHFKSVPNHECFFEEPTVEATNNVNVSENGVTFTYDRYVLGAYACGSVEVMIPKDEIIDYLSNDIASCLK